MFVCKEKTKSYLQNEQFLSFVYKSKNDFVTEYKKFFDENAKAKNLYLHALISLERTISEGNLDRIQKLSSFINYTSEIENQITLREYYENVSNPLRYTNLVILACKHNQANILEYIFGYDCKLLNILYSVDSRTAILPDDEDEARHNAFYYAIRSGNIELLDMLIKKWFDNYIAIHSEKLDEILSRAYEELMLKNVKLSIQIEIFIQCQLINFRFFSNTPTQNLESGMDVTNIRGRIESILRNVTLLNTNYANTEEVDEKFVFVAKSIAQNINVLKRQIKSTYDKLPWEEIEFCLVSFISSYTKEQGITIIYHALLTKHKILKYLQQFAMQLDDEKDIINNVNACKLTVLPKLQRETVVADIIRCFPQLEELYNDYQQIRDIYSLEKLNESIKLALSADPNKREGFLIISRNLQVMGEYLKNTLESPKLSNTTIELLLLSLRKNARAIIITLRNALSHAYTLSKRMEIEDNTDVNFIINIQKDIKIVGDVISDILNKNTIKTIRILLNKIANSESVNEMKEVAAIFSNIKLHKINSEDFKYVEDERIEKLINELSDLIPDKTNYEDNLFNRIFNIINCGGTESEKFKSDLNIGFLSLKSLCVTINDFIIDLNAMERVKHYANRMLKMISPKLRYLKLQDVIIFTMQIYLSVKSRLHSDKLESVTRISYEIFYIAQFVTDDMKWLEKLKEKLNEKCHFIPQYKAKGAVYNVANKNYTYALTEKLTELKNIISDNQLSDHLTKIYPSYKSDMKLQAVVEMLVLDIMSILGSSKHSLENNLLCLDDNAPLLTGKCLRNHLAHDNAIASILFSDPTIAVILNARKLTEENLVSRKTKIGKFVRDNPFKLREKFERSLTTICNQKRMFIALEEGNLENLKDCLKNGTDIYARSMKLRTTLHFAVKGTSLEVVKFILDQNVGIDVKDVNNQSALHIAAANGRTNIVEFFIKEAGFNIEDEDCDKKTPLHFAAQNGHKDTVLVLIKNGANSSVHNICGFAPLHYAIINNHFSVAQILLENDTNVDLNEAAGGFTPLHIAAECGHLELVNFLLDSKANVNARNDSNWTALHAAAFNGHLAVVNALISARADVNAKLINGCTPLHFAIERSHANIVSVLVKHLADVNVIDKTYGKTPIHYAAQYGHEEIFNTLLESQANASVRTIESKTPLHFAVENGHLQVVTILLQLGVDIQVKDKSNATPLHYAAANGRKQIAEILIKNKADTNLKTSDNSTPLHLAALAGHEDIIDLLVKHDADVNSQDDTGCTPLHIAALNAHVNAIVHLLKNNADVNANGGITPLHAAVTEGHEDVVSVLLENKADIDAKGIGDVTPLHMAIEAGHTKLAEILVTNGADVNMHYCNNHTPLFFAIKFKRKEIVEVLIANGANVNANNGQPLSVAVLIGNKDIVDILLTHKARTDFRGSHNLTPIHLAAKKGHEKIVKTLIEKGAEVEAIALGMTPIHLAAHDGHTEVLEILIANGANVNVVNFDGTLLHIAAGKGYNSVVQVLLKNGVQITDTDVKNRTALELAVSNGHLDVVKTILQCKEIDINGKGNNNWTVLHIAAQKGNLEIIKILIANGSNLQAANESGSKPIHYAAREGHKDTVEFFLSKGSTINDLGFENQTLLHYAAMKGQLEIVQYLITLGANVNVTDDSHWSPLHVAACHGYKTVVDYLLNSCAIYNAFGKSKRTPLEIADDQNVINVLSSTDRLFGAVKRNESTEVEGYIQAGGCVNAKNTDNGTPLHYAAWKGYNGVVKILLENKANSSVAGNKGLTPLHYAAKFSHIEVVKTLLSYGAVFNAVSDSGKTPSDFTVDTKITALFKILNMAFKNVKNDNVQVVTDLNEIKDLGTVKAIMCARNTENKSLVIVAMHSNFSEVTKLKEISQGDISAQLNRAESFLFQQNFEMASRGFHSAFEKRKGILGPDNPGTLDIQTFIGKVLYAQGAYHEALYTFNEIYQKQKEILGMKHQDTLTSRSTIALVLHRQAKNEEASKIFQEVYLTQKELLGPDHLDTLETQFHMALVLDKLEKYEEALRINREVFKRRKNLFGANYPATVYAQNNIAMVLGNQGKYEDALEIYEEVLIKKQLVLGPNHRDTFSTWNNIAGILVWQKKYPEALKIHQDVFGIKRNVLGPNHPDTLTTQQNIANVFFSQGKYIAALKAYVGCVDQIKAVYGPNHFYVSEILQKIQIINFRFQLEGSDASNVLHHLQTDINIAVSNGDIKTIRRHINDGANINDTDIDGRSPLHYAVSNGQIDIVNELLKNGADVTQVTNKGNTPLHIATSKDNNEIAEVLLKHVSDNKLNYLINCKTTASGATSLHVAAKNGSSDLTKSFLKQGAIYNIQNNEGETPLDVSRDQHVCNLLKLVEQLFTSAKKGNIEILSMLKTLKLEDFKAVTNARNQQGKTLLQVAISSGYKNVGTKLLQILREKQLY